MGAAEPMDGLDLDTSRTNDVAHVARTGVEAAAKRPRRGSQPERWWFAFDGWQTAAVEDEFVLA